MDDAPFIDLRLHIVVPHGHRRQGGEHVGSGNGLGSALDPDHFSGDLVPDAAEQLIFQGVKPVLGPHDHVLQLL